MIKRNRGGTLADPVGRKLVLAVGITAILGAVWLLLPGSILAGGPTIPASPLMPPLHRHYIVLADGSTRAVGPDWCDNQDDPAMKLAFYNFHWNVHQGAPGLQNGIGTEIKGHPGCGPIPATATP
jgi:hypothetical protein